MISPILPSHDADTAQLRFGVFIAELALEYRTSQAAIIAALMPLITPSQPGDTSRSHAPAADTPDLPAGVKADGVPLAPSAEPIPEAPKPLLAASVVPDDARPAEAKTSAEDALSSASGGVQGGLPAHPATPSPETADKAGDEVDHVAMDAADHGQDGTGNDAANRNPGGENEVAHPSVDNSENDAADEGGQRADAVALGSAVESGAPRSARPMTKGELVRACYAAHPDWPDSKISAETGVLRNSVTAFASMFGLKLVSEADWLAAQGEKTTAALKTAVEAERSPAKRAVTKKGLFNLRDRFGEYLHKNLSVMTRVESYYWEGSEAEILALKKARPGLRNLTERPAK